MVSHHFFYQLVLFALIWLFVMLHLTWPKRTVTAPATPLSLSPSSPSATAPTSPNPSRA